MHVNPSKASVYSLIRSGACFDCTSFCTRADHVVQSNSPGGTPLFATAFGFCLPLLSLLSNVLFHHAITHTPLVCSAHHALP
jgi:hypothetical protein